MNHRRLFCLVLLLLALPFHASAQQPARIEILAAGLYESKTIAVGKDRDQVTAFKLLRQTNEIAATVGIEFGVEYRLTGVPDGTEKEIRIVIRFPAAGMLDERNARVFETETKIRVAAGKREYEGFAFEHKRELVPGEWIFEFYDGERKLAEQRFTVTAK